MASLPQPLRAPPARRSPHPQLHPGDDAPVRVEAASDALRAIAIVAALIVTALFPGIFAVYEQPEQLGFGAPVYGGALSNSSWQVRMYLRAGCASAVVFASGAIVAALTVQIAIATRSVDSNVRLTSYQLNIGYIISLYLLLLSIANTLVVVAFGAYAFTPFPANVVLVSIISAIGFMNVDLFLCTVFCLPSSCSG